MPKKLFSFLLLYFIAFSVFGQRVNILFVGNSLTYTNDLPALVKLIAKCDQVELTYRTLAFPNYALEDHLNDGQVIKEIKSRAYDFVVVQQGPSSQQEGRTMLLNDGLKLAKLCTENKAQLAFLQVWPSKGRLGDFPGVIESYRLAADSTKSVLCPVGNAWRNAWDSHPDLMLYGEDNFHPGYDGSLLAALVIYGSIVKKTNLKFADYNTLSNSDLSEADFKVLLLAAQQTLIENKSRKR